MSHYKNFEVAVYCRAQEVEQMADLSWLEPQWEKITARMAVDLVYLETHRSGVLVDADTMQKVKAFFEQRGVRTAGGITYTTKMAKHFAAFCFTRPESRQRIKQIAVHTAKLFDEYILDDFFFTNCKCEACIKARGDKSWSQYRVELMREAAKSLLVDPSKAVNPDVKVVIKYPNWYEHFQGCGFDLEVQPGIFGGIYTGTETRDPRITHQHLPPYLSYLAFRYFEHLKPGLNGGGWVDTYGMKILDRYVEQLWLTAFSKAPQITLFDFRQMLWPLKPEMRGDWQDQVTSFDFDAVYNADDEPVFARAVAAAFDAADPVVSKLGQPIGAASYRPHHSLGEDNLHNVLGTIGIPIDLQPTFPEDAQTILLTECAKHDPHIVDKIERQLLAGKHVVVTTGLLEALQDQGLGRIAELRCTGRKALCDTFTVDYSELIPGDGGPILLPQLHYITNDTWEEAAALSGQGGYPLMQWADYGPGVLHVLVVPDHMPDLYRLPAEVLNVFRRVIGADVPVRLEGPAQVSLFVYDNGACIVCSFRDEPTDVKLVRGEEEKSLTIPPHSFELVQMG